MGFAFIDRIKVHSYRFPWETFVRQCSLVAEQLSTVEGNPRILGLRSSNTRAWAQVTQYVFQSLPVNVLSNIRILIFIPAMWHMAMLEF